MMDQGDEEGDWEEYGQEEWDDQVDGALEEYGYEYDIEEDIDDFEDFGDFGDFGDYGLEDIEVDNEDFNDGFTEIEAMIT
jgi:hypothetical protein